MVWTANAGPSYVQEGEMGSILKAAIEYISIRASFLLLPFDGLKTDIETRRGLISPLENFQRSPDSLKRVQILRKSTKCE